MGKTLIIDEATACRIYPSTSGELKKNLENTFGIEFFIKPKITDRVKTFEDACLVLGVEPGDIVSGADSNDERAYKQLKVIIKALNEGWTPDWTNSKQLKYYLWFDLSSGSGVRYDDYAYQHSYSLVGSRLCFKSRELAEYAASQFLGLYKDFFVY